MNYGHPYRLIFSTPCQYLYIRSLCPLTDSISNTTYNHTFDKVLTTSQSLHSTRQLHPSKRTDPEADGHNVRVSSVECWGKIIRKTNIKILRNCSKVKICLTGCTNPNSNSNPIHKEINSRRKLGYASYHSVPSSFYINVKITFKYRRRMQPKHNTLILKQF